MGGLESYHGDILGAVDNAHELIDAELGDARVCWLLVLAIVAVYRLPFVALFAKLDLRALRIVLWLSGRHLADHRVVIWLLVAHERHFISFFLSLVGISCLRLGQFSIC